MEKQKKKSTFSWIMEFVGRKKSSYAASVILASIGAVFQILPFFVTANIISKLLDGERDIKAFIPLCLLMAGMWLIRCLFHSLSTTESHIATFAVLGNMRKQGLMKLEKMPLGDVQAKGSGEIKNIIVERIDSVETTLAHIVPEVTSNILVLVLTMTFLFVLDWRMALASLATLPLGLLCSMLMMVDYEKNFNRTVKATKELNDTAVEYIGGIEVIKVFGKVKSSYEKFTAAAKESASSYIDWMKKCNLPFTFAMNIMPATLVFVLPIGGFLVRKGTLSVADFILVIILSVGLITPIINIMTYKDDMAKLDTVVGEIVSIINANELTRPESSKYEPKGNDIHIDNVHFGYGEKEVLHGINIIFKEGTVNALVGPSGSGKSTIAKLIASFWDVNEGSITLGGVDIRDLSSESYYKKIAYVSQDNFLFDVSVRENIRMGNLSATDEQVEQAARECGCYDFIMSLENGFDTVAGSCGDHLSGGEKQRICIARAMLKNAQIIILDEATAYTDPENEMLIQNSIARLIKGKTLIVIAHRLSTVSNADRIVVVNDGRIESTGTHGELLEKCELYKNMWNAHISSQDSVEEV